MAFPTPLRRGTAVSSTTNGTSWTPASWTFSLNTAISAGTAVRWFIFTSADGVTTLAASGWQKADQATDATSAVTGAVFYQDTTSAFAAGAAPAFALTSSASEQFSATIYAVSAPTAGKVIAHLLSSAATNSGTNSNPPALTNSSGASQDVLSVASRHGDSTTQATAAPTTPGAYSSLLTATGGGTSGASTASAERQVTVASGGSEDPGAFTSATEQWVSYTLGIYETTASVSGSGAGSPGTATASAPTGTGSGSGSGSGATGTDTAAAPTGTGSGAGSGAGATAADTASAPAGVGSGSGSGAAAPGSDTAAAPSGIGSGDGSGSGGPGTATTEMPAGTGSGGSDDSGSGAPVAAAASAPGGAGAGDALGFAAPGDAIAVNPAGSGIGDGSGGASTPSGSSEAPSGAGTGEGAGSGSAGAATAQAPSGGDWSESDQGSGSTPPAQTFAPLGISGTGVRMTKQLQVFLGIKGLAAAALPAATLRGFDGDFDKPARIPGGGLVIGHPGEPGEPDIDLGPLAYNYQHRMFLELAAPEGAGGTTLDAMLLALGDAIEADRYLGGLCQWLTAESPDRHDRSTEAVATTNWATVPIIAEYSSNTPLSDA